MLLGGKVKEGTSDTGPPHSHAWCVSLYHLTALIFFFPFCPVERGLASTRFFLLIGKMEIAMSLQLAILHLNLLVDHLFCSMNNRLLTCI